MLGSGGMPDEPRRTREDAKVADVTHNVTAIVQLCRKKAPAATIILMGVFPRNDGPVMPAITRLNANLAKLADVKTVRYLDLNDRLSDIQGQLLDGMTVDRLHLILQGYQIWADALKPLFTELLGHPPPPTPPRRRPATPDDFIDSPQSNRVHRCRVTSELNHGFSSTIGLLMVTLNAMGSDWIHCPSRR